MVFDHRHYVPCLRWKQGEYRAVSRLSRSAKDFITPLIEVPEIGFDFEAQQPSRSADHHLGLFVQRIKPKWDRRWCFVDMRLLGSGQVMADHRHPVRFVFDKLRSQNCSAVPVVGIDRDRRYRRAVRSAASRDRRGACLRVSLEDAGRQNLQKPIDALLGDVALSSEECDFVLDLGAPNFEPVEGFAKLTAGTIQRLPYLRQWRTFTLMGTSFPGSMAGIERGSTVIPRSEWVLYKLVSKLLGSRADRLPTFGDYTINHPDLLSVDMRLVKPSATIRYATDDAWLIVKGRNVRDHKFEQYRDLCRTVASSPHFCGSEFSTGDQRIALCAAGGGTTGNLSTWREVGTNHHMEKVVRDIANYFGPGGSP